MQYWVIQDANSEYYAAKNGNEIILIKDVSDKSVLKFYWFGIMRFIMLKQLKKQYPQYQWILKKFIPIKVTLNAIQRTVDAKQNDE